MNDIELEKIVFNDGWLQLNRDLPRIFSWIEKEQYSEAYVQITDAIKLLQGIRKVIVRLENLKKGGL